jgi:hypothetical protein
MIHFSNPCQFSLAAIFVAGGMLVGQAACAGEPRLSVAEFDKLHKELTSAKEPWQSIPWQVSLLEARTLAARDNKPVYMLCRAGHPLGCV